MFLVFFTFQISFITSSDSNSSSRRTSPEPKTEKIVARLNAEIDEMKANQRKREEEIKWILESTKEELEVLRKRLAEAREQLKTSQKESTELRRQLEASGRESAELRRTLREQNGLLDALQKSLGYSQFQ
jgi:septal ring factor EnvC (AmiA/AmiB activator)